MPAKREIFSGHVSAEIGTKCLTTKAVNQTAQDQPLFIKTMFDGPAFAALGLYQIVHCIDLGCSAAEVNCYPKLVIK